MIAYILRRLFGALPILFGVALVTFVIFHVAGGDPILQLAGKHATAEEVSLLRHEYGLDRSMPLQFLHFLKQIVTFDFERSFRTRQEIREMLADGAGVSLSLTLPAFVFSEVLAILIALMAAAFHRKWVDRTIVVASVLGMSVSILAYILFGQYLLAFAFHWFPISGYESGFPERIRYLILPWLILVVVSLGVNVRFFRAVFLEEMNRDYVRTARAKGASPSRTLLLHILRNAMIPILSRLVIEVPFLLMGSLLLENFFGIPGLGNLSVEAINNADWPVLKAVTILGAGLYVAADIVSDLLYAKADPRVVLK
jgi:peptide/nickel transport system permease protein